jgi:hypothetical protein
MQTNNVEMTVIIHGKPGSDVKSNIAREFTSPQDRQNYIEGRPGSEFSIRLKNHNPYRVLVMLAVDGLSVLDGKAAGAKSPGYVLEANDSLDVPGWVVDGSTAAKFFFAAQEKGYSAAVGQGVENTGVIAVQAFREKNARVDLANRGTSFRGFARGAGGQSVGGSMVKGMAASRGMSDAFGGSASLSSFGATSFNDSSDFVSASACMSMDADQGSTEEQKLSTGFGDATDFKTTKTEFQRGDLLAAMVLWYRDERGLRNVGIDVNRPIERRANPFPADSTGCAVPEGWSR